jgi:transposase InsO family protein
MNQKIPDEGTRQDRWARFRFSVVGPLFSAPPKSGELREGLIALSKKQWNHPITGKPVTFSFSTIENWFYQARKQNNPIIALRTKRREDAGQSRQLSAPLKLAIQQQYRQHPGWSYQLHVDNLAVLLKQSQDLGTIPSYSTVLRYMKFHDLRKQRRVRKRDTIGAAIANERLETREVRGYEMDYVHSLWHLDFHHGSRPILDQKGKWHKPLLLAILDDRSRLICHAQWYLDETAETLIHGVIQAFQKRCLPRALMTDNGAAMISAEFTQGLERLSILHQPTLPYSPYQNAKQEVFWAQVEGRLMAMMEGVSDLTLEQINKATIAWVEFEYHRKMHSETNATPLERLLKDPNVGRECPESSVLRQAFCMKVSRKQRKSDGTFTLDGTRFEVPSRYRHIEQLHIQYARWDLSHVLLVDPHTNLVVCTLYPQDKSRNSEGLRRILDKPETPTPLATEEPGMAPLLKDLMAQYAETGLPPAYLPKKESTGERS